MNPRKHRRSQYYSIYIMSLSIIKCIVYNAVMIGLFIARFHCISVMLHKNELVVISTILINKSNLQRRCLGTPFFSNSACYTTKQHCFLQRMLVNTKTNLKFVFHTSVHCYNYCMLIHIQRASYRPVYTTK